MSAEWKRPRQSRDQLIAAPLKLCLYDRLMDGRLEVPRSIDRGPIEASAWYTPASGR